MVAPAFPKRRILVVDDEPSVCDAVRMMLDFDGHQVEIAGTGEEALARFEENSFDLVIADFAMPGMNGAELATAIKARAPHQPVVLITSYIERLQSAGHLLKGVDFVISKPFLLEDLRRAIAKTTGGAAPKGPAP